MFGWQVFVLVPALVQKVANIPTLDFYVTLVEPLMSLSMSSCAAAVRGGAARPTVPCCRGRERCYSGERHPRLGRAGVPEESQLRHSLPCHAC